MTITDIETGVIPEITLQWNNLSYEVKVKKQTKVILDNVSGHVTSGTVTAIMGSSGGGKTSLLNALAGRLARGGTITGDITINGIQVDDTFRAAYVQQDDLLFSTMTVRETLEFAANMRLKTDKEYRKKIVDEIIDVLSLRKCADTIVGSATTRGVSGGERKRVSIGVQLIDKPKLIFLDEPTSGLDTFQAKNVMVALRDLSRQGCAVVTAIHQPRSSIFDTFDQLMIMSEGSVVYFGDATRAHDHFKRNGFECPNNYNPADYFVDIASVDLRTPEDEMSTRQRVDVLKKMNPYVPSEGLLETPEVKPAPWKFANNIFVEFSLLFQRSFRQALRDRRVILINIFQTLFVASIVGIVYSNSGDANGVQKTQDNVGLIFFSVMNAGMNGMFNALVTFSAEIGIIQRERDVKSYRVLPYYLSKLICDIPLRALQGMIYSSIVYWAGGLNPTISAFFIFYAFSVLITLAGQAIGTSVAVGPKNEKIALALMPMVNILLTMFSGFYINSDSLPVALSWIKYISHMYYGFMGFAVNEFKGRAGWTGPNGFPVSGDQILTAYGLGDNTMSEAIVGLCALIVGYNLLTYIILHFTQPRYLKLKKKNK
jgi:ABC-type multidrug transport system ATPase subunit/ABC-type multidrug transport system permease subunit